ncbi:MAG: nuclear transport factor 2 family protein [Pseudomonadota bacterium]
MPSADALNRFVAQVESNAHVEAIAAFYAPHATMRENNEPQRVGRDTLMAHEAAALSRTRSVHSQCVHPVFVNGDYVVIRWVFQVEYLDGTRARLEELAYQRWEGDQIVEEQFFYDPRQMKPTA